jgi:hypothetical protein
MITLVIEREPLSDALQKIKALASDAINSDGQTFLSEKDVKAIAAQALSKGEGSNAERQALECIWLLVRAADQGSPSPSEVDILDLCEKGLAGA